MLLSAADLGETIKQHERERERERENERKRSYDGILVEIIRGHWPMFNRTMLSLQHVSLLSILKMIKDPLISLHVLHNNQNVLYLVYVWNK